MVLAWKIYHRPTRIHTGFSENSPFHPLVNHDPPSKPCHLDLTQGFFHVFPISRYILQPPRLSRSMSPSHKDRHRQLRAQQFPNVQVDHPSVFPGLSTKLSSHFAVSAHREKGVQVGICLGYVQYCAVVWAEKDENRESIGTTNQINCQPVKLVHSWSPWFNSSIQKHCNSQAGPPRLWESQRNSDPWESSRPGRWSCTARIHPFEKPMTLRLQGADVASSAAMSG